MGICLFFPSIVFAIDDSTTPSENSQNFVDYSEETFFQSSIQLDEIKKDQELEKIEEEKTHFVEDKIDKFSDNKGTITPIKKVRYKVKMYLKNRELAKQGLLVKKEEVPAAENGVIMNCKTMQYHPENSEMEAIGDVSVYFPIQDMTLKADRMIYSQLNNVIQAFDNVSLAKAGNTAYGDYMKINLDDETSVMDKVKANMFGFEMIVQEGESIEDTIVAKKGFIKSLKSHIIDLKTPGFGYDLAQMIIDEKDKSCLKDVMDQKELLIKVKYAKISAKKEHDTITFKHATFFKGDKKLVTIPSMTFYTNKEHDYAQGNFPEIGSLAKFGFYAGPGVVLETPLGSTLKLIPTINHKDKLGFGGLGKYRSGTNWTDFGYSSSSNKVFLNGYQKLDDGLRLQYGANTFLNDWFLGQSWVKYGGELVYEKAYRCGSFIAKDLPLRFAHRISGGMIQEDNSEDEYNKNDKYFFDKDGNPLRSNGIGTLRLRYMAEITQTLYKIDNEDERKIATFDLVGQGAATAYGTGDTQFIGRIGPRLHTQYKYWMQDAGFFLSTGDDNTPMPLVDAYRYGKANVYLKEYLRIHKFLTLGWYGSANLSDDSYDGRMIQECRFFAAVGPDDFKLNVGWDVIRNNTFFGLTIAMDTKNSVLDFDKIEIKNPSGLGKSNQPEYNFEEVSNKNPESGILQKAVVTDIEDSSLIMSGEK